jgi:hypothetical protein
MCNVISKSCNVRLAADSCLSPVSLSLQMLDWSCITSVLNMLSTQHSPRVTQFGKLKDMRY